MATVKSGMLSAGQVTSITVINTNGKVGVLNRTRLLGTNSSDMMWVRTDGIDPAPLADDSYPVYSYRVFDVPAGNTTVKIYSDYALEYTVEGN